MNDNYDSDREWDIDSENEAWSIGCLGTILVALVVLAGIGLGRAAAWLF